MIRTKSRLTNRLLTAVLLAAPVLGADTTATDSSQKMMPAYRVVTGGPVTVQTRLLGRKSARPLTVGDRFEMELVVKRPRSLRVTQPFFEEPGDFLVIGQHMVTREQGDTAIDNYHLKMVAFAPGDIKVPPFLVAYQDANGSWAAASESVAVKITSVLPKGLKDINEIKPQVQFPNLVPIWVGLGVVLAAGLAVLGYRLFRRLQKMQEAIMPLPEPWDEALAALGAIPVLDWLDSGHVKRYYYAVSEILKRYLTRRFGFPAIDQTTTEIAHELKRQRVGVRDRFLEFFGRADMVKYAKLVPPRPEMEGVIDYVRELIHATTPQPAEPVTDSSKAGR